MARADDRELLASAAHELKTPIAAIRGAATALRRDWDGLEPETRQRLLGVIASAGDQLARLADDLLAAARGTGPGRSVEPGPCDVAAGVRRAVEAARAAAPEASIELEVTGALPPALADPGRLEQVVANLVQNALRHGGGTAEVSVAAPRAGYGSTWPIAAPVSLPRIATGSSSRSSDWPAPRRAAAASASTSPAS